MNFLPPDLTLIPPYSPADIHKLDLTDTLPLGIDIQHQHRKIIQLTPTSKGDRKQNISDWK